jgi:hypothetical protein
LRIILWRSFGCSLRSLCVLGRGNASNFPSRLCALRASVMCQAFALEALPPDGFLYLEDPTVGRMIARAFLVLSILLSLLFVRLQLAMFFEDIRSNLGLADPSVVSRRRRPPTGRPPPGTTPVGRMVFWTSAIYSGPFAGSRRSTLIGPRKRVSMPICSLHTAS